MDKEEAIKLTLEGYPDAEDVGVLMADERGYFQDAGLDVEVLSPIATSNVTGYVEEGVDDVGLVPQPQLVMAREEGVPLVAVGSLLSRPTMAMIWLKKSKIADIAGLKGKTIAINGLSFEEGFIRIILARAGLTLDEVKIRRVGHELVQSLVDGDADAIFGGSSNVEGAELEALDMEPVITPVQRLGMPSYEELVVIARKDRVSRGARWIGPFMSAVARGTAAAVADPEAAVEAVMSIRAERSFSDARKSGLIKARVEATLPLLSESLRMSPERAENLVGWMCGQGMVSGKLSSADLLTNRYVR